ncbi:hypothetical protein NL676_008709 [Syzygium grande]|nr:hypothetical protein NL676_008709 [Syzygium grande]
MQSPPIPPPTTTQSTSPPPAALGNKAPDTGLAHGHRSPLSSPRSGRRRGRAAMGEVERRPWARPLDLAQIWAEGELVGAERAYGYGGGSDGDGGEGGHHGWRREGGRDGEVFGGGGGI